MAAPINLFFLTCLNRLKTRTGLASMYFFIFANVANDLLKFLATSHNFFAKCEVANAQRYPSSGAVLQVWGNGGWTH